MCDCETGVVPEDEGTDELGFEKELWDSANKMRGSMDASAYKHVVLPIVFLKYISDSFEAVHSRLIEDGDNPEDRDEYEARGVFWVPEAGRFASIKGANDPNIGAKIDDAMDAIEKANPELRRAAQDIRLHRPSILLGGGHFVSNLDSFGDEEARSKDIIGNVYEYFIGMFAEAKKRRRRVYASFSGSLNDQYVGALQGRITTAVVALAACSFSHFASSNNTVGASTHGLLPGVQYNYGDLQMNLAIRRIEANLGEAETLRNDNHPSSGRSASKSSFNIKSDKSPCWTT